LPPAAYESGAASPWKQASTFLTQLVSPADLSSCYREWLDACPLFTAAIVTEGASLGEAKLRANLRAQFKGEIARVTNDLAGRRLAAQALSFVGDDRLWEDPTRPLVPALVRIPAGTYRVGLSQTDLRKLFPLQTKVELELVDEEFQCSTHMLPEFAISKFAITNDQFRQFVEHGGYSERAWWEETGWQWLQAHGGEDRRPDHWSDRLFNAENQPVVGVNFHEANAYCRWLTATAADGRRFRLPTVAEWQAAARGIDGRLYPWGDEPAIARCNCWHAEDYGLTSPVGVHLDGVTPEGIYDLAGNTAEWAFTNAATVATSVCGGSWFSSIHRCRATQIRVGDSGLSSTEIGFRVVSTAK